jgi:hypothetical protein
MTHSLTLDAVTGTYGDVERVLNYVARQFTSRLGGDYDEVRADVNSLFMDAYASWEEGKASFPTWVRFKVTKGLLERIRSETRVNNLSQRVPLDSIADKAVTPTTGFNLDELSEGLSEDGKRVVDLVLRTPRPITERVLNGRKPAEKARRITADRLVELLTKTNWSVSRIMRAFAEVSSALEG